MRIAITCANKERRAAFVDKFAEEWPMYTKIERVDGEDCSDDVNALECVLNDGINVAMSSKKDANVVMDGSIVDAMASIYVKAIKDTDEGESPEYLYRCQGLFNASVRFYDIIFVLSSSVSDLSEVDDLTIEYDPNIDVNVDMFIETIFESYTNCNKTLFPTEDCPPLIKIGGTIDEAIVLAKLYIKKDGTAFGQEDSLLAGM